ncbi:MAG: PEP/pyruvate-binding domain-containing protein, partial [Planctomycetota bacterium]
MSDGGFGFTTEDLPQFDPRSLELQTSFSRIGSGSLGGKAQGLVFIRKTIESRLGGDTFPGITIDIPPLAVVATDVFDAFMEHNGLYEIANAELSDDEIANAFQQADLPQEIVGDLEALIDQVHSPLAVRSSSLLEDDRFEPFAGVYQTKMIPNNQPDRSARLRRLVEAIKFVYASTYFKAAKSYIRATEKVVTTEKMAVIIQKAVGHQHNGRFYPQLSGVGRSFNFYPLGTGKPEEGVVNLVLGLGKTIMDGDLTWSYSPARPLAPPPFASPHDRLKGTQTRFWAVRMSPPPTPNPTAETEFLIKDELAAAEQDGTLTYLASTYDGEFNRVSPGTTLAGPRVLDFAPLLVLGEFPLNEAVKALLSAAGRRRPGPPCRSAGQADGRVARTRRHRRRGADATQRARGVGVRNGQRRPRHAPGRDLRQAGFVRDAAHEGDGGAAGRDEQPAHGRGPPVSAHRVRPMGHLRSLARHPGEVGADLRSKGRHRGDTAGHDRRAQPGIALFSQHHELPGQLLLRAPRPASRHRLGMARSAADHGGDGVPP